MSEPYTITFSKALVDSGALESVHIDFRMAGNQHQHQRGHVHSPSVAQDASSSLSSEPAYYSCTDNTHLLEQNKFYVVTKGVKPGIYYCWPCAKFDGKGADQLPSRAQTYCEKKTSDVQAREFWRQELEKGNVRYWTPRGMHVA